jgi:UDP-glucose 4-epimerase
MKTIDMRGANVLITGGAGFIGSNLARRLVNAGSHVTVVDAMISPYGGNMFNLSDIKKKIRFIEGDVRAKRLVKSLTDGQDFIFHLAGQTGRVISMQNPKLDYAINCLSTLNILNAVKKQKLKSKVILASSRGVIGEPQYLPVDENHPTFPRDVYGAHKLVAENYCLMFAREDGIPVSIVRLNNIYGPGCQIRSNHYGTINLFISYALRGKALPVYGEGIQTRDYVYVSDVVEAFLAVTHHSADNDIFFVSTNTETSLLDIVQTIKKVIKKTKHTLVPYPKQFGKLDFDRFVCSYDKIHSTLGWVPNVSIEEGIKKTAQFYKKNLQYYL